MKRTLPSLFLHQSPLVLVIAQVRISPVLKMETFVADIQEALRNKGYPGYKHEKSAEISIIGNKIGTAEADRWFFLNSSSTESVILSHDFIALCTTDYSVFEDFSSSMESVLNEVNAVVGIDSTTRLGLRYIDLVRPDKNEPLDQYLQPSLLGFSDREIDVSESLNRFEFIGQTNVGRLDMKCTQHMDGSILPDNLDVKHLNIQIDKPDAGEKICILDFDHFNSDTNPFDISSIINLLDDLHDNLDRAFRKTVTSHALQKWGQEKVDGAR